MYNLLQKYLGNRVFDTNNDGGGGSPPAGKPPTQNNDAFDVFSEDGFDDEDLDGVDPGNLIDLSSGQDGTKKIKGLEDVFDAFNDGDDDDLDPDDTTLDDLNLGGVPKEKVTAMEQLVQAAIGRMQMPADAIPEDFDPSNRQHVQALQTKTIQAAVQATMGVVFEPVKLALEHAIGSLQKQTDAKLRNMQRISAAGDVIASKVPEINHPQYRGMVRAMDEQLKSKGKKPEERAVTLRKMLNNMGINIGKSNSQRRASSPSGGGSGGVKTGTSALDKFFGGAFPTQK